MCRSQQLRQSRFGIRVPLGQDVDSTGRRAVRASENLHFVCINPGINEVAKERGKVTYLTAEGRNGYTGLDEYSSITQRCIRTIKCGTPKDAISWCDLQA